MIAVGYTGTRRGMSWQQAGAVLELLRSLARPGLEVHHGCCVGGDEEFHRAARTIGAFIVGHPGPDWPDGIMCARVLCDFVEDPRAYAERNQAIVEAISLSAEMCRDPGTLIAAPHESAPRPRGGTHQTIRMGLAALRAGRLDDVVVIGRDGARIDPWRWAA